MAVIRVWASLGVTLSRKEIPSEEKLFADPANMCITCHRLGDLGTTSARN